MAFIVVGLAAILTSALTLFSGFGLGTLLMPAFALFFTVDMAVVLTAIVHFLNNLFKLALVGRHADARVVMRFGIPALVASFAGAVTLMSLTHVPAIGTYDLGGKSFEIDPVNLVIALLMAAFALFEVLPAFQNLTFKREHLVLGGVLSGFFGGLSGHQGALRSAFLAKAGLSRDAFIGTNVVIACLVDVTRLAVYAGHFREAGVGDNLPLLVTATACAFFGAFLGTRFMHKVTMKGVQVLVTALLLVIAVLLGAGMI